MTTRGCTMMPNYMTDVSYSKVLKLQKIKRLEYEKQNKTETQNKNNPNPEQIKTKTLVLSQDVICFWNRIVRKYSLFNVTPHAR